MVEKHLLPATTTCSSCGEPIRFVTTMKGKTMPVELDQLIIMTDKGHLGRFERVHGYISHFSTCPHADRHSR